MSPMFRYLPLDTTEWTAVLEHQRGLYANFSKEFMEQGSGSVSGGAGVEQLRHSEQVSSELSADTQKNKMNLSLINESLDMPANTALPSLRKGSTEFGSIRSESGDQELGVILTDIRPTSVIFSNPDSNSTSSPGKVVGSTEGNGDQGLMWEDRWESAARTMEVKVQESCDGVPVVDSESQQSNPTHSPQPDRNSWTMGASTPGHEQSQLYPLSVESEVDAVTAAVMDEDGVGPEDAMTGDKEERRVTDVHSPSALEEVSLQSPVHVEVAGDSKSPSASPYTQDSR